MRTGRRILLSQRTLSKDDDVDDDSASVEMELKPCVLCDSEFAIPNQQKKKGTYFAVRSKSVSLYYIKNDKDITITTICKGQPATNRGFSGWDSHNNHSSRLRFTSSGGGSADGAGGVIVDQKTIQRQQTFQKTLVGGQFHAPSEDDDGDDGFFNTNKNVTVPLICHGVRCLLCLCELNGVVQDTDRIKYANTIQNLLLAHDILNPRDMIGADPDHEVRCAFASKTAVEEGSSNPYKYMSNSLKCVKSLGGSELWTVVSSLYPNDDDDLFQLIPSGAVDSRLDLSFDVSFDLSNASLQVTPKLALKPEASATVIAVDNAVGEATEAGDALTAQTFVIQAVKDQPIPERKMMHGRWRTSLNHYVQIVGKPSIDTTDGETLWYVAKDDNENGSIYATKDGTLDETYWAMMFYSRC